MRRLALAAVLAAAVLAGRRCCAGGDPPHRRVATFNIEDFPKSARQVPAVFDELARLDAAIVGVQEIIEADLFAATARDRLGASWEFISLYTDPPTVHPVHHLGVLFDRRAFAHVSTRSHDGTRLEGRHKPTLDVELRDVASGEHVRILVVHLKAGGENQPIRARQVAALRGIVAEVQRANQRVILLGDFNATSEADRRALAQLASATALHWVTEPLACSSFWARDDGCVGSRLDHALTTAAPVDVRAAGACATHGCERRDSCPVYTEEVSDHCPVVLSF
jgi:endonuclease/exonuclease/phosphatase family metal-dependent hydrolase